MILWVHLSLQGKLVNPQGQVERRTSQDEIWSYKKQSSMCLAWLQAFDVGICCECPALGSYMGGRWSVSSPVSIVNDKNFFRYIVSRPYFDAVLFQTVHQWMLILQSNAIV